MLSVVSQSFSGAASTTPTSQDRSSTSEVRLSQASNDTGLVKMLSFNIEVGGRDPNWKEVIHKENPDVVLLVETGSVYSPDNLPGLLEELNSYFPNETPYDGRSFKTDSDTDGQAVLSRYPIKDRNVVEYLKLDSGETYKMNHPVIDVTVNFYGQDVHILVEHLSCCDALPRRTLEQEAVMNYVDSLGDVPVIYGGDFNSNSPQDVGEISPFMETLGTEPIDIMINSSNPKASELHTFTDSYRALNPERKGYTLNSEGEYFNINHFRSRIDYIFVDQRLVDNLVNSSVVNDYYEAVSSSDHMALYTYFDFKLDDGGDQIPPISPTGLTTSVNNGEVQLNWQASTSSDVWKYSIYRNDCLVDEVPASQTNYTDDYLLEGDALNVYEVYAVDTSMNVGRPSLKAYAIPNQRSVVEPDAPVLSVEVISEGLNITWTLPDNGGSAITRFLSYKYFGEELVAQVGSDPSYVIDRQLAPDKRNYVLPIPRANIYVHVFMIAENVVGESAKSNDVYGQSISLKTMEVTSIPLPVQNSAQLPGDVHTHQEEACFTPKGMITELPNTGSNSGTDSTANFGSVFILSFFVMIPIISKYRKHKN